MGYIARVSGILTKIRILVADFKYFEKRIFQPSPDLKIDKNFKLMELIEQDIWSEKSYVKIRNKRPKINQETNLRQKNLIN